MSAFDLLVMGLLAVAFAPAIANMASIWSSVDYFAHGFLVPVVALGVAWTRRAALADVPRSRDGRGAIVLVAALALYATGIVTSVIPLQGVACVAAVAGAVLLLRGPGWLRVLVFPVAYLGFMVPLPPDWIAPLITGLQLWVSEVAVDVLHAFAVPVAREGNVILVPGGSLFVAEACSGITSIVTFLPVAVLLGYFTQPSWPGRVLLVVLVVPFAMLGNLARVLFTVVAATELGVERATSGLLHEIAGLTTYAVAVVALLLGDLIVRRASEAIAHRAAAA